MGFTEKLKHKIQNKKKELEKAGEPSSNFAILGILIKGAKQMLLGKWYLRKCNKKGSLISVNKKPLIVNKGYIELGDEVRIWSNINKAKIFVDKGAELIVGNNSRLNGSHISVSNRVIIGNNVRIAPYNIIIDNDFHKVDDHFSDEGTKKPIAIEDDAWITMNCTIMKGVTIGRGAVVASGSVVTKDVPPYTVVAGVPAKVIKTIKQ
jgi:acetyltransferase-like isoleucine patch superfamily enzyme